MYADIRTSVINYLQEVYQLLRNFLRNPIVGMKEVPEWDARRLALFQVVIAAAVGLLAGLFEVSPVKMVTNPIFFSIYYFFVSGFTTLFFYFAFQFLYKSTFEPIMVYRIVAFAQIPHVFLKVLTPLRIPIDIVGMLVTC
ncbi:MAG: hypothetical protein KDD25_07040, partial [Bdellovibrionales bacterium]|nr:hypothetical protein [Bdellovibrionales bacterium]